MKLHVAVAESDPAEFLGAALWGRKVVHLKHATFLKA